jgi:hypothetical protein
MAETSARLSEESEKRTDHRPALRFIKVSTSSSLSPDTLSQILQRLERDALVQKEVLLVRAIFRVSQLWSKPLPFFGVQPAPSSCDKLGPGCGGYLARIPQIKPTFMNMWPSGIAGTIKLQPGHVNLSDSLNFPALMGVTTSLTSIKFPNHPVSAQAAPRVAHFALGVPVALSPIASLALISSSVPASISLVTNTRPTGTPASAHGVSTTRQSSSTCCRSTGPKSSLVGRTPGLTPATILLMK